MRNIRSKVLRDAEKELELTNTLSELTQIKVRSIARSKKPGNWPFGRSNKRKAYYLLQAANKHITRRWIYSFSRKNSDLELKEKNLKKIREIFRSVDEAVAYSSINESFETSYKKALYKTLNKKYVFLEDVTGNETVDLIKKIQKGSLQAIRRMVEKKVPYFSSRVTRSIPYSDRVQIATKAIIAASQKAIFVGGFNKYINYFLRAETSNYFKDFPNERTVPFSHRLEELADLDSIKLFDKETYQEVLEQSEQANGRMFAKLDDVNIPPKIMERFNKLISSDGKSMSVFMNAFKDKIRAYDTFDPHSIAEEKLIDLFYEDALVKNPKLTRDTVERVLEDITSRLNEDDYQRPITDFEGNTQTYLKQRKELIEKEVQRLVNEHKEQFPLTNDRDNYFHMIARTLADVESTISSSNLLQDENDTRTELIWEAESAANYFLGFEAMPWEFQKAAVISKINNTNVFGAVLDSANIKNYCLIVDDLNSLRKIANPKIILQGLYTEEIVLTGMASDKVYLAAQRDPDSAFLNRGVFVFKGHPLLKEINSNLNGKATHELEEIIENENFSGAFLVPVEHEQGLGIPYYLEKETHDEQLKEIEAIKEKALETIKHYEDNNIPLPELVSQCQEGYELAMVSTKYGKIIIDPKAFYSEIKSYRQSYAVSNYFDDKIRELQNEYQSEIEKDYRYTWKIVNRLSRFWTEFKDLDEPTEEQLMSKFDDWGGRKIRDLADTIELDRKHRSKEYERQVRKGEIVDKPTILKQANNIMNYFSSSKYPSSFSLETDVEDDNLPF